MSREDTSTRHRAGKWHAYFEKRRRYREWSVLFDERALAHFWWPSRRERREYRVRYQATPMPERALYEYQYRGEHGWDFLAMIAWIQEGFYTLVSCQKTSPTTARLEYYPQGLPFGGTEPLHALIEAFDFTVTYDLWQAPSPAPALRDDAHGGDGSDA